MFILFRVMSWDCRKTLPNVTFRVFLTRPGSTCSVLEGANVLRSRSLLQLTRGGFVVDSWWVHSGSVVGLSVPVRIPEPHSRNKLKQDLLLIKP